MWIFVIKLLIINCINLYYQPITLASRSNAWNVFALWNTGIVGSNTTRGMDVGQYFFCVRVVLCR
jgi:hypothetical protein